MYVSARAYTGYVTRDVMVQIGGKLYSVGQNCVDRPISLVTCQISSDLKQLSLLQLKF